MLLSMVRTLSRRSNAVASPGGRRLGHGALRSLLLGILLFLGCGRSTSGDSDDPATGGSVSSGGFGGATSTGGSSHGGGGANAGGTAGARGGTGGTTGNTGGSAGSASGSAGSGTGGDAGGDSAGNAGSNGSAGSAGSAGAGGSAGAVECVAAIRMDECCSEIYAVSRAELAADPCWKENPPDWSVTGDCPPVVCPAIPCPLRVSSRLAEPDASGVCRLVSECATTDDCTAATNTASCCACPESYPKKLVERNECLAEVGSTDPPRCGDCQDVNCDACAEPPALACLVADDGINLCGFAPAATGELAGKCTAEQACVADRSPGIRCFAPGEMNCAGPAPPEDECALDSDCTSSETPVICEPLGHCGATLCVPGCSGAEDCGEFEECGDDARCAPKACDDETPCGGNHGCVNAICARRACTSSSECAGYCVKGQCHETPGDCWDAFAP